MTSHRRVLAFVAGLLAAACGRTAVYDLPADVAVVVDPGVASVRLGESVQFAALRTPVGALVWSVEPAGVGAVDARGLYTAPSEFPQPGLTSFEVVVRATAAEAPDAFAEARVTVRPAELGPPARVEMIAGDGQTAVVNEPVPEPLVVQVRDAAGRAVPGVTVRFEGADVVSALTDASGIASATPRVGTQAGQQELTATVEGLPPVGFTIIAEPGPVAVLVATHPTGRGRVGTTLDEPARVTALDAFENPVPGERLVADGPAEAAILPLAQATDAAGVLPFSITLAPTSGEQIVTFTHRPTDTTTTLALRSHGGPATALVQASGDEQTATVGTSPAAPLVVRAIDADGHGSPGVTITWRALDGGRIDATVTTDDDGLAEALPVLGTVSGPARFEASAPGLGTATVGFVLRATAGPAQRLQLVGGGGQITTEGHSFGAAFSVRVTDAYSNGVAEHPVRFSVVAGGGHIAPGSIASDPLGLAQAEIVAGSVGVQRYRASAPGLVGSPIEITGTAVASEDLLVEKHAGDGQEAPTGDELPQPIVVRVTRNGEPVANRTVAFGVALGDGAVYPRLALTGSDGLAYTTARLGPVAGSHRFSATVAGASGPVFFDATAIDAGDSTSRIQLVSGAGQSGEVGLVLAEPVVVRLTEPGGRPAPNVEVTFRADDEMARVDPTRVVTDADGRASTTITLGRTIGTQRFFAEAEGFAGSPVVLTATGLAAPAERLVIVDGDGQRARTGSPLPGPLVVRAVDRVGNGVAGVEVTFAPGSAGLVTPTTTVTDAAGEATASATLGTDAGPHTFVARAPGLGQVTFTATATAPVTHVSISPQGIETEVGSAPRFTAMALFQDGRFADVTADATWSSTSPATLSVSDVSGAKGVGSALAPGAATVRATFDGVTGETVARVVAGTLRSIVILPATPTLVRGSARAFTAVGTFSNDAVADVTEAVEWTSTAPAVATVSDAPGSKGLVRGIGAGTTTITARLGQVTATRVVSVTQAPVVSLEVTPLHLVQPAGTTALFRAIATHADGVVQDVTEAVAWESSDPALMTVQNAPLEAGRATFLTTGTPEVLARYEDITARARVTITNATVTNLVAHPTGMELAVRDIFQFRLVATWSDGTVGEAAHLATWQSSNPAVADVSNAAENRGTVTAITTGTATVTASLGGRTASVQVAVSNATIRQLVVVEADGPGFPGAGVSCPAGSLVQLVAVAEYSNGGRFNISDQASWSSSASGVAVVANGAADGGLVQCLAPGTTTITAAWRGRVATATVDVSAATLTALQITPASARLAIGDVRPLVATGVYSNGARAELTDVVTWTSEAPAIAAVSNAPGSRGRVVGVSTGTTRVSATLGGVVAQGTVTVRDARLTSVVVTPSNPFVRARDGFVPFSATALYDDGSQSNVTEHAAWTSSDPRVAIVSNEPGTIGVAVLEGEGSSTIAATYAGVTQSTVLTVRR